MDEISDGDNVIEQSGVFQLQQAAEVWQLQPWSSSFRVTKDTGVRGVVESSFAVEGSCLGQSCIRGVPAWRPRKAIA